MSACHEVYFLYIFILDRSELAMLICVSSNFQFWFLLMWQAWFKTFNYIECSCMPFNSNEQASLSISSEIFCFWTTDNFLLLNSRSPRFKKWVGFRLHLPIWTHRPNITISRFCVYMCTFKSVLTPDNCLDWFVQFSREDTKVACHCLFPRAEKEWQA